MARLTMPASARVVTPPTGSLAITPDDDTNLSQNIRAITIAQAGTVSWVSSHDGQTYSTNILPAGYYPMFARRIRATGTSAEDITGWI